MNFETLRQKIIDFFIETEDDNSQEESKRDDFVDRTQEVISKW